MNDNTVKPENKKIDIYTALQKLLETQFGCPISKALLNLIKQNIISIEDPKVYRALAEKLPAQKMQHIKELFEKVKDKQKNKESVKSGVQFTNKPLSESENKKPHIKYKYSGVSSSEVIGENKSADNNLSKTDLQGQKDPKDIKGSKGSNDPKDPTDYFLE